MKNLAKLYFQPASEQMARDVAQRIRLENNLCHLIYSGLFRGPEDCQACDAVIIEVGAPRVELIEKCYRAFNPNVEIHHVDSKGEFISADQPATAAANAGAAPAPAAAPAAAEAARVQPAAAEESDSGLNG